MTDRRAPALFTKHRGIALGIAADYYYLPGADAERHPVGR